MINDARITTRGRENELSHGAEGAPDPAARKRPFVAPQLKRDGAFTEITTQFAGDFSA